MSLTIWFDIGNTRGKFWLADEAAVMARSVVVHEGSLGDLLRTLPSLFDVSPSRVSGASVLDDEQNRLFALACQQKWGIRPEFAVGQAHCREVSSAYRQDPAKLGVDRWLGLLAVGGRPGKSCIVSCGTAITVDVLESGKHSGGYIVPGLALMQHSLRAGSALVRWAGTSDISLLPGINTAEAVEHGVLLMGLALVERVVRQESPSLLLLTGGDAAVISTFIEEAHVVEPELVLKGLRVYFAHH